MAYPSYYQPMQYQYNPVQVPTNNTNLPPIQQNSYPQILAYVHGIEGANLYQMGPNSKALLMDLDDDAMYIKTTDPMARAYPLEAYSITKKELPTGDNVTREEYNKLVSMLEEQKKLLDDLTK